MTNIYSCTPRKAYEYIVDCLEANLIPNVKGSPGIGKSALFKKAAKTFNLEMLDHRVSTSAPEDFTGLPEFYTNDQGKRLARFVPFGDLFPLKDAIVPVGKDGWLLFLDEFNSGTKMVQAASYKLLLDRMTGLEHLHERVRIGTAGNLMSDRAIVNQLSTAMQSRLIHIKMEVSFDEWLYDVALPEKYDDRIIAFLNYEQGYLMDFRADHDDETFCCPRTWEFMNALIKGKEFKYIKDEHGQDYFQMQDKTGLYAGTITSGVAAAFVAFCALQNELVQLGDVLKDPNGAPVPFDAQRKWVVVGHLMGKVNEKNFGDICTYINRFDLSFRVLFFRSVMAQHPELRSHPEFAKAMIALSRYLNG